VPFVTMGRARARMQGHPRLTAYAYDLIGSFWERSRSRSSYFGTPPWVLITLTG
jgi:hypothetical protein